MWPPTRVHGADHGLDRTGLPMAAISPDGRWLVLHVHLMPTRTDVVLVTGEWASARSW